MLTEVLSACAGSSSCTTSSQARDGGGGPPPPLPDIARMTSAVDAVRADLQAASAADCRRLGAHSCVNGSSACFGHVASVHVLQPAAEPCWPLMPDRACVAMLR